MANGKQGHVSKKSHSTPCRLWVLLLALAAATYICNLIALLSAVPSLPSGCELHQVGRTAAREETAAICAIVKDEELYLEEWALYHLGLGFRHIYLYDNSPQLSAAAWRHELFDAQIKASTTVVPFSDTSDTRQYDAYRSCMQRFGSQHTWVAVIDPDEFVVLHKHPDILSLLRQHCQRGSLSLHWLVFGTSQQRAYHPDPVTKRFRHVTDEHRDSFKSIIRVADYKNFTYNPHWAELNDDTLRHDTSGDYVQLRQLWSDKTKFSSKRKKGSKPFPFDVAAIHHYKYKSVQEYQTKLCQRGDVLNLPLCSKDAQTNKIPTGDMSVTYDRAYELLLQNVPKYRVDGPSANQNALELYSTTDIDASTVFVISLQGTSGADRRNEGRLDAFRAKWNESCKFAPPTHIQHCPGVFDPRRGYGLALSWLLCLEQAKQYNLDVTVIFEDDARLFDTSADFCEMATRKRNYWDHLPHDTFIAFLGGHNWEYPSKEADQSSNNARYKELKFSFGTYAFAIPRHSLDSVLGEIKDDIVHGFRDADGKYVHRDYLSPERTFYRTASKYNKKIYAVNPLAIWHEGGFSNTWMKNRASITGNEKETLINQIRGVDPD